MSFTCIRDFGQLYRMAYAEPDERKKVELLREVERIIKASQTDVPQEAKRQAKAA